MQPQAGKQKRKNLSNGNEKGEFRSALNKPREGKKKIIKRNPATRTRPSTSTQTPEARIPPRKKNKNPSNNSRRNI
jgi:hypothetical protein